MPKKQLNSPISPKIISGYVIGAKGKVITQSFNKKNFNKYLQKIGLPLDQKPTFNQKQLVFLMITQDYFEKKMNLSEFSGMGQYLDDHPQDEDIPELEEYKRATFAASELIFEYKRFIETRSDNTSDGTFETNWEMMKVLSYFEKYRHLLEK